MRTEEEWDRIFAGVKEGWAEVEVRKRQHRLLEALGSGFRAAAEAEPESEALGDLAAVFGRCVEEHGTGV